METHEDTLTAVHECGVLLDSIIQHHASELMARSSGDVSALKASRGLLVGFRFSVTNAIEAFDDVIEMLEGRTTINGPPEISKGVWGKDRSGW